MKPSRRRTVLVTLIFLFIVGEWALDLNIPLGIADWAGYVIPLMLSIYLDAQSLPFLLAASFSVLTLAGFYLSPPGLDPHPAFVSRLLGISVFWLMAFVIWQRKRTEVALKESELRFSALFEDAHEGVFQSTPGGQFHLANPALARMLGYASAQELIASVTDIGRQLNVDPGVRAEFQRRIAEQGEVQNFEFQARRKDGTTIWLSESAHLVRDTSGAVLYYEGTLQDITERKRVEAELNRERDLWRMLLNNSPDHIYFKDIQSRFIKASQAQARQFGVQSPDEMTGKTDFDFFDEAHARPAFEDEQEIIRTGQAIIAKEEREVWKDGHVTWASSTKLPMRDTTGKIIGIMGISRDITERKRAEKQAAQEQARFKLIFDSIPIGIAYFVEQPDGRHTRIINDTHLKICGLTREQDETPGIYRQITHPEDYARQQQLMAGLGPDRTGEYALEKRYIRPDGRMVWVVFTFLRRKRPDGNFEELTTVVDITERKQAEAELSRERDLWRILLDTAPDHIYFKDVQSRFIKSSKAQARQFGLKSPDEMVGKTDFDFFDEAHARPAFEDEQEIIRTGRPMIAKEEREVWIDGHVTWASSTKLPMRDTAGKIIGVMGISRDITERKQMEMALRESEHRFQTLADVSPVGIFRTDAQGQTTYVNPQWCRIAGLSATEALGEGWLHTVHPEDREKLVQGWQAATQVRSISKADYRFVHPDGTIAWVMGQAVPEKDNAGCVVGYVGIITDITERKQAEDQLRRTNAFLDSVIENIPNMLFLKDARTLQFVRFNRAGTDLLGCSKEDLLGKTDYDFFEDKKLADWFTEKDREVLRGKQVVDIPEESLQTRDKGERIVHTRKVPVLNANGEPEYLLGISEDITEVKLAREKLRERESFLSAITENQPGLLWLKDAEGRFLTVNTAFAAACGRSDPEQVRGLTDWDIWPKEMAEKYRRDDQQVISTGKSTAVEEMISIGDKHVWHETFKTPVRDDQGRVIGTTGYARDITERKLAEEQLVEAFSFNRKIISDASVGILAYKSSGQCVLANESAARALNATVPQLLNQDFRQIVSWRASGMLQIAEKVLAAKMPRQCEANFTSSFGKAVSFVCHFSPFVQGGEPHLLLIFNDVTEKKKLEAQFLRAQRMESIGTLAGGIAHDLNNVLAPLLISILLLKDKVTDAEGRNILAMLETNVNRGTELVKQVLAFGRGMQGERVLVQLKHIAGDVRDIIRETFPKSLRLQMEIPPDLWKVTGDATQIHQVLLNLCVNARDAMPAGGSLSLGMENKVLDENYAATDLEAKPGRYVVISVTDTGEGMLQEVQERIFEPFFTTKEHGKGTGLGLSTTLAIVKSHGGFIHCYSEPGKGTTFKVYFPVGAATDNETGPVEEPRRLRGHNELVMVVDDEESIRALAQKILERFGYRVLLAANGAEAVKLYTSRQNEIAVVITDMAMPVMDGPSAIVALRAINPNVRIIGSSGLDSGNKATAALRHFMPKPYTADVMLDMLHEVLRENPVQ